MAEKKNITNPGSALGEAVGKILEESLNNLIKPLVEELGYVYINRGPKNKSTGRETKLLLTDSNGVQYNVDAVITNEFFQPLILLEYKYIRYKKHNRDKGSWVCTAHTNLKKRFSSIRSSITVLAGNWSETSQAMMRGSDITLFGIPFSSICEILSEFDVPFDWSEKDRDKAYKAWDIFSSLDEDELDHIGQQMVNLIEEDLTRDITQVLDSAIPREIVEVEVHISTNLNELKIITFDSVASAVEYLEDIDNEELLSTDNSPTLLDNL